MHPLNLVFHGAHDEDFGQSSATNASMVEELGRSGALKSPECIAAFLATDRRHFWIEGSGSPELIYADMPLRTGRLHLSAPHIYAKALESLMPLRPGMSFLNVGSGTGYFNSIVAELTGEMGTNHGIDIWPETIHHARERCWLRREQKKQAEEGMVEAENKLRTEQSTGEPAGGRKAQNHMEFTLGNVYQLDVNHTMRYDRIYLGACANSKSKYLYRLLEVGGILIGPFQTGHTQQLRRVVRASETQFNVEILGSVQFACLVEPAPVPRMAGGAEEELGASASRTSRAASMSAGSTRSSFATVDGTDSNYRATSSTTVGLPYVPFNFYLLDYPWMPERCWLFPLSYKQAVGMSLSCRPRNHALPCLHSDLWIKHIFPFCPSWWFEPPRPATPSLGPLTSPASLGLQEAAPPPPSFSPLPERVKCSGDVEEDLSDDGGGSTQAPSSGVSSTQTTPMSGPSSYPQTCGVEVDEMQSIAMEEDPPISVEDVLFEVFSNGQRHAIGARNDPDDVDPDEPLRLMVPLHVLQLLARDTHNRRWERHQLQHAGNAGNDDDHDDDGDHGDDRDDADDEDVEDERDYGSFQDAREMVVENEEDHDLHEVSMQDANDIEMEDP